MKKLSEEDINELYTYCALNEDEENIVAKISEMNEWKKAYVKSFTTSYVSELQKPNSVRALYCDPDTTYKKGFNHHCLEYPKVIRSYRLSSHNLVLLVLRCHLLML